MLKKFVPLALFFSMACAGILAAADAPAGKKISEFVLAETPQHLSLDPLHTFTSFESQFYTAIYEGLVVAHPLSLEPVAGVAMSWDSSEKGRVWRFMLRPDAAYSNGDKVRAQDFVAAWMRMLDPANTAEYSFLFDVIKGAHAYRTGAEKNPATVGITAVADDVLRVELESPAAHFLKLLTHISFLPLHPSLLRKTGWDNAATVIGNGPFLMKSRSDAEIVLDRNPVYWDARNVGMDRLRIRFISDPDEATDGYAAGRIHWVTASLISSRKLLPADKIEVFPMFGTTYFFFGCDTAPWSDWRVRRGLALLVPWDTVRTREAFIYPSELLIPADIPGYPAVTGIAAQNVEEAKKLLADAGFPGGKGLPPLVVKLAKDSRAITYVQKMADAWKSLAGLETVIREVDPDAYLAETRIRDYALALATWIGDYADPLSFLQIWTTGSNLNDARFSDADYDAAVKDSISILDSAKRSRRLADAEQILLTKAAILPLDHSPAVNLINTRSVDGWYSNPLDVHPFKFLKYKGKATPPGIALRVR